MPTVDLDAMIEALERDGVVRAKLRAVLLSEELLALPLQVGENSRQIAALGEQVAENSRQIAALGEQVAENSRQIAALVDVTRSQGERLDRVEADLGSLKGSDLEQRVWADPVRYLSWTLRRGRAVHATQIDEEHRLAAEDFVQLVRTDAIISGSTPQGAPLWVVIEASWRAHRADIERAKDRARILSRIIREPVLAVVASNEDPGEVVVAIAVEEDVALVVDNEVRPRAEGKASAAVA